MSPFLIKEKKRKDFEQIPLYVETIPPKIDITKEVEKQERGIIIIDIL